MIDIQTRERAIQLRKEGYLYGQIARSLDVAKSTVRLWTKDLVLTEAEEANLKDSLSDSRQRAVVAMNVAQAKVRAADEEMIRQEALETVRRASLDLNNQRIMCAIMFWCEGEKSVEAVKFINSDPVMMKSFLTLLRGSFQINESKLHALLHLHEYHNEKAQVAFWSEVTCIPSTQFYKSYIKPHTGKNMHEGYPGCLSLRYGDARLAKLLKMIYSSLGSSLGA